MNVIDVAPGIHWVEIPEADLRILCGAPADAVKHLMKRGLIKRVNRDGAGFETGPNAILLSDTSLQAGEFCNLAEFPVLQMLYRQGMILPDHPNNTGAKPLLIGLPDQLRAQLEYIHRGNYGLSNTSEMRAVGMPADVAEQWMAVKLHFAFGKIRRPDELLDTLALEDAPVEVAGGVTLKRLDVNVFEFKHGDDVAIVDLNLPRDTRYRPPYPLNFHDLEREYFAVVHSGNGDGWDVDNPTMSSVLMFQGRIYLVDAGPNLHAILRALGIGIQEVEGLFHTHCHDDHFAGLTTLVQSDHKIKYYATPSVRESVTQKLTALMGVGESVFADFFEIHDLMWDTWNDVDGLQVRPVCSPHPVETSCFVFRALWSEGWRSYAHMADIAAFDVLARMREPGIGKPAVSQDLIDKVRAEYLAPATLKKIDIGGGLIHGKAEDFAADASNKIILGHTAFPLTPEQRSIGSGAPFGTVDTLIETNQDYTLRAASEFLGAYFPDVPDHQIRMLLNQPVESFNPQTLFMREGRPVDRVFVILSGMVEVIESGAGQITEMSAGAVVGEMAALTDGISDKTTRALSFVRAIAIPADLYRGFIHANGLEAQVRRAADLSRFFMGTWLLGDNISALFKTRISQATEEFVFEAGEAVDVHHTDRLVMIREGAIDRIIDGEPIERMRVGNFLGTAEVLQTSMPASNYIAPERTVALAIPGAVLRDIPVVRLKLLETFQRRMRHILSSPQGESAISFPWMPEYGIGVPHMDAQHRELFVLASRVLDPSIAEDVEALDTALDDLIAYSNAHFRAEETFLAENGYPGLEGHREIHRRLIEDMQALRTRVGEEGALDRADFRAFCRDWIINHIFGEDSRYARHLAQAATHYAI